MKSENRLVALTDPSVIERLIGTRPTPKVPVAKDFVRAYSHAIRAARENGWTVDQIHDELQSAGVQIEIRTLRKYVSDLCGSMGRQTCWKRIVRICMPCRARFDVLRLGRREMAYIRPILRRPNQTIDDAVTLQKQFAEKSRLDMLELMRAEWRQEANRRGQQSTSNILGTEE
jgi:hypothetical protein